MTNVTEYEKTIKLLHYEIDNYISTQKYKLYCVQNEIKKHQYYIKSKAERPTLEPIYIQQEINCRKDELKNKMLWRTEYNERLKVIKKLDKCLDLNLNIIITTSRIRTDNRTDATTEVAYADVESTVLIERLKKLSSPGLVRSTLVTQLAFKALKIVEPLERLEPYNF